MCLRVKSRVGFSQSPRLRSMQQDGLKKGRVEYQFRIQTKSPVSPYSVQLAYYGISETDAKRNNEEVTMHQYSGPKTTRRLRHKVIT